MIFYVVFHLTVNPISPSTTIGTIERS